MQAEKLPEHQIEWFNAIRAEKRPDERQGWTKTCPCGDVFYFEMYVTQQTQLDAWIAKHFGHTGAPLPKKTEFSMKDLYDFSKEIRFSKEGFDLFVQEYQLKINVAESTQTVKFYTDTLGNRFTFKCDSRGNAQIVPKQTEVYL